MAQRLFAFEQPLWRIKSRSRVGTGLLLLLSAGWLFAYGLLGYRLWASRLQVEAPVDLALIGVCVVLGVAVFLAWRRRLLGWIHIYRRGKWPPLNLEQLRALSPAQFEEYVAYRLFQRKGYRVKNTPDVKDGGVDILVTDHNGQTAVVQCKRYRGTVGEPVVRDLLGTMVHNGATYGYLVTSGAISEAAHIFAADKPIDLVDGLLLVELARAT